MVMVRDYLLSDKVTDSRPVKLTDGLDYTPSKDSATYQIYGDVSYGWSNGDDFAVRTVFKVSAK